MKVAIWGSYAYNNYGDELMGLMIAVHLKKLGARPVIFSLDPLLADRYGVETTSSADDLIEGAVFCVFGGGSLLSSHKQGPDWYLQQKEQEYDALVRALERYQCPLYFISIGGDGEFNDRVAIAPYRSRLLKSTCCREATVRQEPDIQVLRDAFNLDATFYPDMLMDVAAFWELSESRARASNKRFHIGVNLPSSSHLLIKVIRMLPYLGQNVSVHFVSTVRTDSERHQFAGDYLPDRESDRVKAHAYKDPVDMLRFLQSLDVIFTPKLHIGLTALAMGVPYICVGQSNKSKAFLYSIDARWAFWGEDSTILQGAKIARLLIFPGSLLHLRGKYDADNLDRQRVDSRGHLGTVQHTWESLSRQEV